MTKNQGTPHLKVDYGTYKIELNIVCIEQGSANERNGLGIYTRWGH